jgi:CRP-like cAMP-binding protein
VHAFDEYRVARENNFLENRARSFFRLGLRTQEICISKPATAARRKPRAADLHRTQDGWPTFGTKGKSCEFIASDAGAAEEVMLQSPCHATANLLLALLPTPDLKLLLHPSAVVSLPPGRVLYEGVYFPLSGLLSTYKTSTESAIVHTALFGCDGAFGLEFLASQRPSAPAMVLTPSTAVRISYPRLLEVWQRSDAVREMHLRYCDLISANHQQTGSCNSLHNLEQRLNSWLLNAFDRVGSNILPVTQQIIANMLGVQRTSVNQALDHLQDRRLVTCGRGKLYLLDRGALEAHACECYQSVRNWRERCLSAQPSMTVMQCRPMSVALTASTQSMS